MVVKCEIRSVEMLITKTYLNSIEIHRSLGYDDDVKWILRSEMKVHAEF